MTPLSRDVYGILTQGAFLNAYLIDHEGALTLIDVGLDAAFVDVIVAKLQDAGYTLDALERILITHAHPDHIGGLASLGARRAHRGRRGGKNRPLRRPAALTAPTIYSRSGVAGQPSSMSSYSMV